MNGKTFAQVENGIVVNLILWDGKTELSQSLRKSLVPITNGIQVSIGDYFANKQFRKAEPKEQQEEITIEKEIEDLRTDVKRLEDLVENLVDKIEEA